jgi:hypothetical protein
LHGGEKFGRGGTIKFYRTGCDAAASEAREEWGGGTGGQWQGQVASGAAHDGTAHDARRTG